MVDVKRFSIVFLMVMFLANTTLVSAWAKPCMMNDDTAMSEMSSSSDMGDTPPCHEENKSEKQAPLKHCEGICLCLHVSLTQTPLLTDFITVPDIHLGTDTYTSITENMTSRDYSPSNPPPIFNS
jgi:hypothetical protein